MLARLAGLLVCVAIGMGCGILRPAPAERSMTGVLQLAYVGSDDQIYVAEADGSNPRQITRQVSGLSTDKGWAYRWPTYSPDGSRLAFAAYPTGASQQQSAAVLSADVGQARATAMLEAAGLATIYLYWSPDNRHVAALLQHGSDLELHLLDATGQEQPRQLVSGQPLYWSWAPDAGTIAVHVGGDARSAPDAWVGLLHLGSGSAREERFTEAPGGFQAPAWSWPDGKLAYVALGGGTSLLSVRDKDGRVTRIASSTQDMAFSWSPRGDWLAFAEADSDRPGVYQGVQVAHADGGDRHRVSQDPLLAFYWSPDGGRLALVGLDMVARALTWTVVSVDGKTSRAVGSFLPSNDFAFQLPFFDQFAQSTSVWSADGRRIVYGASIGGERTDGSSPRGERVMVVEADGQTAPATVATGGLAVWSPPAR